MGIVFTVLLVGGLAAILFGVITLINVNIGMAKDKKDHEAVASKSKQREQFSIITTMRMTTLARDYEKNLITFEEFKEVFDIELDQLSADEVVSKYYSALRFSHILGCKAKIKCMETYMDRWQIPHIKGVIHNANNS